MSTKTFVEELEEIFDSYKNQEHTTAKTWFYRGINVMLDRRADELLKTLRGIEEESKCQ